jgi:MFS family permease
LTQPDATGVVADMSTFGGNTSGRSGARIGVLCVVQFVLVLDATIVTTALPSMARSLELTVVELSWVVTGYTLSFGGLLVLGGRVADLVGPRRVLLVGLGLFAAASAACAAAGSGSMLVGARLVQGAGAAVMSPAALALLTQVAGSEGGRRAVGWWTAAAATGGASGWVAGGLLTDSLGWRSVFWVNVPLAVAGLVVSRSLLPAGRRSSGVLLDVPAAVGVTAALALLVLGLTSAAEAGPGAVVTWVPLLVATLVSVWVVRHERRVADPLLPPGMLQGAVAGASLSALALTASTTPAMMLSVLYLQQVLHLSAVRASMLFPIFNVAVTVASLLGARVLDRLGARVTTAYGFGAIAVGAGLLALLPVMGSSVALVLLAFTAMGAGLGVASVTSTHVGTAAASPAYRGVVSGVLTAAAQVGTTIGLALLVPVAGRTSLAVGFAGAAVVAVVGAWCGRLLPGRHVSRLPKGAFRSGPPARSQCCSRPESPSSVTRA